MSAESPIEQYLELALRLGKHDDELVDSFYGSDELAARIAAEEPREPAVLADDADALLAELGDDPWLAAQVQALATNARKFAGERLDYVEEGRLVYGIEPRWCDEESFRCGAEVLCNKPGGGELSCCDHEMKLKEAKPLPSSD